MSNTKSLFQGAGAGSFSMTSSLVGCLLLHEQPTTHRPMKELIIAIDGPVGSGKSTLARRVAELMGYVYIDTGAMYRALALKALRRGISLDATDPLIALARETRIDLRAQDGAQRVFLDGEDVTAAIRTPEVSQAASKVAVVPGVRQVLVAEQ